MEQGKSNVTAGAVGVKMHYFIPNPRLTGIDPSNIFLLRNDASMGTLDLDTNEGTLKSFLDFANQSNIDRLNTSNDEMVKFSTLVIVDNDSFDVKKQFRIAYKYEDNGVVKYAYTPTFVYTYNSIV